MLSPSISLSNSPFQTSSNKDHMSGLSGLSIKVCQCSVWQHCTATVASSQHTSSQPPLCCWGDVTVWHDGPADQHLHTESNLNSNLICPTKLELGRASVNPKFKVTHNFVLKGKHFVWRIFTHNYLSKNHLHVTKSGNCISFKWLMGFKQMISLLKALCFVSSMV